MAVMFSWRTTDIANSKLNRERNYDSIILAYEISVRLYPAYAAYYISVFFLISRNQVMTLLSATNIILSFIMLMLFNITAGWVKNDSKNGVIFKALCDKTCKEENNCDDKQFICNKKVKWSDIKRVCNGKYKLAIWVFIFNVIISLSPLTR